MNINIPNKGSFRLYEYFLYWLVTLILLALAIPLVVFLFIGFLLRAMSNPAKSMGHLFGFIFIILLVAAGYVAWKIFVPYDIGPQTKSVIISQATDFPQAIKDMKEQGILRDITLFRQIAVRTGLDKIIAPGRYDFSGRISFYGIYQKFKNRDIATLMLTIPEGLPAARLAGLLAQRMHIDSATFMTWVFDTANARQKYNIPSLEGYLFPETYRLWYGMSLDQVVGLLVAEFFRRTGELFGSPISNKLTRDEIITLASIIEAEATDIAEMGLISSVYHNRLKKRIMLQADPTVIYGLGGLSRPLNRRDIRLSDSPYNTYKKYGLPPGPINSPGLAAIRAAMNPDSTEYLYFVADGKGKHIFSKTLKEHNAAVNRVKRLARQNSGS